MEFVSGFEEGLDVFRNKEKRIGLENDDLLVSYSV